MILVDYSQVAIASIMAQTRGENTPDEDLVRHIILNNIRLIRNKFKNDYGEIVLCCDAGNYWRKDIFPHYKASRKTKQSYSFPPEISPTLVLVATIEEDPPRLREIRQSPQETRSRPNR